MSRKDITHTILREKIIAIIRTPFGDRVPSIIEALYQGGIRVMEVTFNTPDCLKHIQAYSDYQELLIGAGTVMNASECEEAIEAGAQFLVSPISKLSVIERAHRFKKPVLCGAYTPNEIYRAFSWGSDIVKVFPSNDLRPTYLKSVLAPMSELLLAPTGGITVANAREWLEAGAVALGVGSGLVSKKAVEGQDYKALTSLAHQFCQAVP